MPNDTIREIKGKSPNGGVRTTLMFFDANRVPVKEKEATFVEVIEYAADESVVARNYLQKRSDSTGTESEEPAEQTAEQTADE